MATHVLKLQYGADKRSPTRTLDLLTQSGSGPYLRLSGFAPGAGVDAPIWSGQTALRDGQRFVDSTRDNVTLTITYDLSTTSPAELAYHQRQISRFIQDTRLWQRDRIGAPAYLRYRWGEGLSAIGEPVFGQFSYFYKILYAEVETWPGDLHTGALVANYIESVELRLICEPYAEGLQQTALDANGLPGVDSDVNLTTTLANDEINQDFTIAGWITHRDSDYYVCEYYVDSNDYLRVFWDESDDRFELVRNVAGSVQTRNGSTGAGHSAGDKIHIAVISDFTTDTVIQMYVNGSADGTTATAVDWANSGTFTIGVSTSDTTPTANADGVDAWRIWTSELTAANITSLYNAEEPIKTAGNSISPVPYLKTRSGDGVFENVDGVISAAAKDNWGVIGWVPGDVPAKVRWEILPPTATPENTYWLGRRASDSTITPLGTLFLDFNTVSDSGNSSGDGYDVRALNSDASATITDTDAVRGRHSVLTRMGNENAATITPKVGIGSADKTSFTANTLTANAARILRYLGDIFIDWPEDSVTQSVIVSLGSAITAGTNEINDHGVSHWQLEEGSGTRADSIGDNDLTDNNTVPSGGAKIGSASASFTAANSEYLSITDTAQTGLSPGDTDFTLAGWIYLSSKPAAVMGICGKDDGSSNREYVLYWTGSAGDRFQFSVFGPGQTDVTATTFGAPSTATWYFIYAYHDATNNEIGISINDGTVDTSAHTTGVSETAATFYIGQGGAAQYWDGLIDSFTYYNKKLSAAEVTAVYNSASGLDISEMTVDFVELLPYPNGKATYSGTLTITSDYRLVIEGVESYVIDTATSDKHIQIMSYEGTEITVVPERYNYIVLNQGAKDGTYPISDSATVTCKITPRYQLPGGLR